MNHKRITVSQKQLAGAIAVWLRHIPKRVWDQWIEHRILQHYKRQSLSAERLDGEVAAHIAGELTKHDWEVTYPAPSHPGMPSEYNEAQLTRRRDEG